MAVAQAAGGGGDAGHLGQEDWPGGNRSAVASGEAGQGRCVGVGDEAEGDGVHGHVVIVPPSFQQHK